MKRTTKNSEMVINRLSTEELDKQYYTAIIEKYSNLEAVSYSIDEFNQSDGYGNSNTEFVVLFKLNDVYSKEYVTIPMGKIDKDTKEDIIVQLIDNLYDSYGQMIKVSVDYDAADVHTAFCMKYRPYCQDTIKFLIEKNNALGAL